MPSRKPNTQSSSSRRSLASLTRGWNIPFLLFAPDGNILAVTNAYAELMAVVLGGPLRVGTNLFALLAGHREWEARYRGACAGEEQRLEFSVPGPDGSPRWLEALLSPIAPDGRVEAVTELVRDMTAPREEQLRLLAAYNDLVTNAGQEKSRYRESTTMLAIEIAEHAAVEKALKESGEWLGQIIGRSSIPTFVIDRNHTITHWNLALERLTGFPSAEMVGTRDQWKAFYLNRRPTMADLMVEVSPEETISSYYKNTYRRSALLEDAYEAEDYFDLGGNARWLFFTAAPIRNARGEISGAMETLQDITDRKLLEKEIRDNHLQLEKRVEERTQQLKLTYEQLLHAEKLGAVGKLAASIAHEFGNPVIGIRNFLKGLKKTAVLDSRDTEMLDLAIQECQRIKELIASLRDFNRPTSGTFRPMDLHRAIDDMLLFCKKKFKDKHIRVVRRYAADLPKIAAVEDQIKQVILNCLNNAEDAIPAQGGTITITTGQKDRRVQLHIRDTGHGIKPDDFYQIFEPFFTTKPAAEGTGLGLAVSYGIIKRHCGSIEVTDTSEKGTTFTLTLPIDAVPTDAELLSFPGK